MSQFDKVGGLGLAVMVAVGVHMQMPTLAAFAGAALFWCGVVVLTETARGKR